MLALTSTVEENLEESKPVSSGSFQLPSPGHMVHFNGPKFLGPFKPRNG